MVKICFDCSLQRLSLRGCHVDDLYKAPNSTSVKIALGLVLFNIFINDLDEGVQGMLVRFLDDTKLGAIINTLEDRNKIQNDLDTLEHWDENNRMK